MPKAGKKNVKNNKPELLEHDNAEYRLGLHSSYVSIAQSKQSGSFFSKMNLEAYAPLCLGLWVFAYAFLGFGLLPLAHAALTGIALILTGFSITAVLLLFRARADAGPWPANRVAAMVMGMMTLDFWLWVMARPFEGLPANIYLGIDLIGFSVLVSSVYMFVYKKLHIDAIVKLFVIKAFFDFAAYVLSGGFGLPLLSGLGVSHPLNIDVLFGIAMLELWILLFYILKYRNKIHPAAPS